MQSHRIGHGYDIHRLQKGGKLLIGGVVVSEQASTVAHSDGDVALHALVDAIYGALGLGDIGEHFPDTDPAWKDASSEKFLAAALAAAKQHGYAVCNADITVQAEWPKLKAHKDAIKKS